MLGLEVALRRNRSALLLEQLHACLNGRVLPPVRAIVVAYLCSLDVELVLARLTSAVRQVPIGTLAWQSEMAQTQCSVWQNHVACVSRNV